MTRQCSVVPCQSRRPSGARRRYEYAGLSLVASLSLARVSVGDDAVGPTTAPILLLRSEGAGCPGVALVETQLEPLMPDQRLAIEGSGDWVAEIRDLGSRYEVRVAGDVRVLDDPRRDCLERARAAAVIIALAARFDAETDGAGADGAGADGAGADGAGADGAEADGAVPVEKPSQTVVGVQLLGTLDHAAGVPSGTSSGAALGASLGVVLVRAPWRVGGGAGFVAPVTLGGPAGEAERFRVLRLPVTLTGGYLWDLGVVQLGPGLGAVVEAVQLQGVDTPGATAGWRWNVGAVGTLASHWSLGSGWAAVFGLRGTVFPKVYDAWVEPDRSLGSTPRWWLGTFLGIEHILGRKTGPR